MENDIQPRRVGYARVSTGHQGSDGQVRELQQAGCTDVRVERCSGARADRPVLEKLLEDLKPGDTLVVTRLDRLGRSLPHLLAVVNGLAARGIGFECLHQPVSTTDATGRLVLAILGALAEFERELIRERVRNGVEAAKERGVHCGRPTKISEARLEVARSLLAKGTPMAYVARALGVSRQTLYRHKELLEA